MLIIIFATHTVINWDYLMVFVNALELWKCVVNNKVVALNNSYLYI